MHSSLRPLAAGSVAIVGAGFIAATPIAIAPVDLHRVDSAVRLTANADWGQVLGGALAGFSNLVGVWNAQVKAPVLQQVIANRVEYLLELPDFPKIFGQMQANVAAALNSLLAPDTSTLDPGHQVVYAVLPLVKELLQYVPFIAQISDLAMGLLSMAASPLSGVLLGLVSPGLGATLVLGQNMQSIATDLNTANLGNAISTLFNTPAQMTDAFLNGGTKIDITGLVSAVGPLIGVAFPNGVKLDVTLGGLFSPGGSIFNALGIEFSANIFDIPDFLTIQLVPGAAVGPIGSAMMLGRAIAKAIGWNGIGDPLASIGSSAKITATPAAEIPHSVAATLAGTAAVPTTGESLGAPDVEGATASGASDTGKLADTKNAPASSPDKVVPVALESAPEHLVPHDDAGGGPSAGSEASGAGLSSDSAAGNLSAGKKPSAAKDKKRTSSDGTNQAKHRRSVGAHAGPSSGAAS